MTQTDFGNEEAVGYLADRLTRLGVEKELARPARSPATRSRSATSSSTGSPPCGEEFASGMRGQDARLEDDQRVRAGERRLQKDIRRAERLGSDRSTTAHRLEDAEARRAAAA